MLVSVFLWNLVGQVLIFFIFFRKTDSRSDVPDVDVTNDKITASTSTSTLHSTEGSETDVTPLEEWDSDSTFDYDDGDVPLAGYSKFILATYETKKLPFRITQIGDRIMLGYFYEKRDSFWSQEADEIRIKKKDWVRNLVVSEVVTKGSKRRPVQMYKFEM